MKVHQLTDFSLHARSRAAQRGIREVCLADALLWGESFLKGGRLYTVYGDIVTVEANGRLVTAYRDGKARRNIRRKTGYATR